MEKIAILGGSFDPVHKGHLLLLQGAGRAAGADKLFFIPAADPPHKPDAKLAAFADRLEMCRLAARDIGAQVTEMEAKRGGKSYTVDTLRELREQYPNDRLLLVCGSDMFLTLQQWRNPEGIFALAEILAVARAGESDQIMRNQKAFLEKMGARFRIVSLSIPPWSSTEIRKFLREGKSAAHMLPPAVADYIQAQGLYR